MSDAVKKASPAELQADKITGKTKKILDPPNKIAKIQSVIDRLKNRLAKGTITQEKADVQIKQLEAAIIRRLNKQQNVAKPKSLKKK